jgi:hypothetical protein
MDTVPLISGILDPHPDGTYVCVKCTHCLSWHCAPAAGDMAAGQVTHLVARCTVPGSPYRETGYSVVITGRRTRRSRSCARGRFWWGPRPMRGSFPRPQAAN